MNTTPEYDRLKHDAKDGYDLNKMAAAIASAAPSSLSAGTLSERAARFDAHCVYCAGYPDAALRHAKHLAYLWATSARDTERWQDLYEATERAIDALAQAPAIQAPEAVAVVEAIGNGKVEAMLLKNLPEGTLLFATPSASVSAAEPVPEGWKLVPIQDTPTMWTAGGNAIAGCGGHARDAASLAYAAMLDAAPAPTQPQQGTGSGK